MSTKANSQRTALLKRLAKSRSGSEMVALSLLKAGVDHVYAVGGAPIDSVLAACQKSGLKVTGAHSQQGACLMSSAHNYVAGSLKSAVIVSAGPALTNCATGILVAYENRWPLLVIAGRLGLSPTRPGAFQNLDSHPLFATISKSVQSVLETDTITPIINRACIDCMSQVPGPVVIELTDGAISGNAHWVAPSPPQTAAPSALNEAQLIRVAQHLSSAKKGVLLVGQHIRWDSPWNDLLRLVDATQLKFATTPMARGFLPDHHPLCCTQQRSLLLAEADLVLVAGTDFDWSLRYGCEISPTATIVRLGCSGSTDCAQPNGWNQSKYIDLPGQLGALLPALVAKITQLSKVAVSQPYQPVEAQKDDEPPSKRPAPSERPTAQEWLTALSPAIPSNAITVIDGGIFMVAAQDALSVNKPLLRLTPGASGCMGIGVPFAIGAKLAQPELPVVVFTGDFAFGLNAMELETAVRNGIDLTIVIGNNEGINGHAREALFFGDNLHDRILRFHPDVQYAALADSLGAVGRVASNLTEVKGLLTSAIESDRVTFIELPTCTTTAQSPAL